MSNYAGLNKNVWIIIVKYLPETEWKNIIRLNKSFKSIFESRLLIKSLSYKELILKGHIYNVCHYIKQNSVNMELSLKYACVGGQKDIVNMMIKKGANYWNQGLYGACKGGDKELVNIIIERGADDWNEGLYGACRGGHKEIANLMIEKVQTIGTGDYGMHVNEDIKK